MDPGTPDPLPPASAYRECRHCRALNLQDAGACEACGNPMEGDAPAGARGTAAPAATVALDAVGESVRPERECPRCSVPGPAAARFCEECGSPLEAGPGRGHPARGRGRAAGELGRALRVVRTLRGVALFSAVVSALLLAAFLFAGLRADGPGLSDPEVLLPVLLLSGQTALMATAWVRALRDPFFWCVLVAAYVTLSAVLSLLAGEVPILMAAWAIALWAGAPATIRVRALLDEYPDLRIAHALRGDRAAGLRAPLPEGPRRHASPAGSVAVGTATLRARERAARTSREGRRHLPLMGAVAGMVLLFGVVAVFVAGRGRGAAGTPPPVEEFRAALESGDADSVQSMFPTDSAVRLGAGWREILRRREWDTTPPRVREVTVRSQTARSAVILLHLAGEEEPLLTRWNHTSGQWRLTGLRPPPR